MASNNATSSSGPTAAGGMHMLARGSGTAGGIGAGYAQLAGGEASPGAKTVEHKSPLAQPVSPVRPVGASPSKTSPRPTTHTKTSPRKSPRTTSVERSGEVRATKPVTFSGSLQPHTYRCVGSALCEFRVFPLRHESPRALLCTLRAVDKAPAPGPGAYEHPDAIGKQTVST